MMAKQRPTSSKKSQNSSENDQIDEESDDFEYEPPIGSSSAQAASNMTTTNRSARATNIKLSSNHLESPILTSNGHKRRIDNHSCVGVFQHHQSEQDFQSIYNQELAYLKSKGRNNTNSRQDRRRQGFSTTTREVRSAQEDHQPEVTDRRQERITNGSLAARLHGLEARTHQLVEISKRQMAIHDQRTTRTERMVADLMKEFIRIQRTTNQKSPQSDEPRIGGNMSIYWATSPLNEVTVAAISIDGGTFYKVATYQLLADKLVRKHYVEAEHCPNTFPRTWLHQSNEVDIELRRLTRKQPTGVFLNWSEPRADHQSPPNCRCPSHLLNGKEVHNPAMCNARTNAYRALAEVDYQLQDVQFRDLNVITVKWLTSVSFDNAQRHQQQSHSSS